MRAWVHAAAGRLCATYGVPVGGVCLCARVLLSRLPPPRPAMMPTALLAGLLLQLHGTSAQRPGPGGDTPGCAAGKEGTILSISCPARHSRRRVAAILLTPPVHPY